MSEDHRAADTSGEDDDPIEIFEDLLAEIAESLQLDVEIDVEQTDDALTGSLRGEDVGLFIGRRGQTIDAVQHLAQRIVFQDGPVGTRVIVDADGYRERRAEALCVEADDAAADAVRSGEVVELEPMLASERRIVHEHLRDREDIETYSEGEEPRRYLVVSPLSG